MTSRLTRAQVLGAAAAVAGAVLLVAALSPQGLGQYRRLTNEVERMREQNALLERGNAHARADMAALRHSRAFQEKAVREDLGYVKSGDRLYIVDVGAGPSSVSGTADR